MASFLFILLGLFWGGSYVAIRVVVEEIPPFFAASIRVGLAILFLTIILKLLGKSTNIPKSQRLKVWAIGLLMQGIPFALLFWAEQFASPGLAGIINGAVPLFTFAIALFFLKKDEEFTFQKYMGLCVGFAGIIIIFFPKFHFSNSITELLGVLAFSGVALSYSIGIVCNRKVMSNGTGIDRYAIVFHQTLSSFVFLTLLFLWVEGPSFSPKIYQSGSVAAALIYLSLFSNAIAWIIFFYLIQQWGAVKSSTIGYIIPPVTLLGDYALFGRFPSVVECIGAGAILMGVVLVQTPSFRIALNFGATSDKNSANSRG